MLTNRSVTMNHGDVGKCSQVDRPPRIVSARVCMSNYPEGKSWSECLSRRCTWVNENKPSTARSTFARVRVNVRTDVRTQFVIADRPKTIVWAITLSSQTSIWRFMAIWLSVECLFSITPVLCSDEPFCQVEKSILKINDVVHLYAHMVGRCRSTL